MLTDARIPSAVERRLTKPFKEANGAPTSRSDVQRAQLGDRLRGASPRATEPP